MPVLSSPGSRPLERTRWCLGGLLGVAGAPVIIQLDRISGAGPASADKLIDGDATAAITDQHGLGVLAECGDRPA